MTWVVGAGGLLGRHVTQSQVRAGGRVQRVTIPWSDPPAARAALRQGAASLLSSGESWAIAWCAGAGVVATPAEDLELERELFATFLDDFAPAGDGAFFLASSAGGVYAGSAAPPFNEQTEPRPLAPYGVVKLAMEHHLREWATATSTPTLIGRIANLYGPGQDLDKGQGLISQICRSGVTGRPVQLYVSLDTIRDYVFAGDCAAMITAGLAGIRSREELVVTKILGSGQATTIATLVGESRRISRRPSRLIFGASTHSAKQVRDLRLRSTVWPELDRHARTPLPTGLAITARDVTRRLTSLRSFDPSSSDQAPRREP